MSAITEHPFEDPNIQNQIDQANKKEEKGVEKEQKTDSSSMWIKIENKEYRVDVSRGGKNIALSKEQKEKIVGMVLQMMEGHSVKTEKPLRLRVTAQDIHNESVKVGNTDTAAFSKMQEIIKESTGGTESKKDKTDLTINIDSKKLLPPTPERVKHLFLIESHDYIGRFFDELIKTAKDAQTKKGLEELKQQTLQGLVGGQGIYTDEKWLNEKGMEKSKAKELWSGKGEAKRQKEAARLLNSAMYRGLCLLEKEDGKINLAKVHKQICQDVASQKKFNVINEEGKIDIKLNFTVQGENGPVNIDVHTSQFGDNITGSMEPRKRDKEGKLYGVNIQTEEVSFKDSSGKQVTTTQLRSGSFDFADQVGGIKFDKFSYSGEGIEPKNYNLKETSQEFKDAKDSLDNIREDSIKDYIKQIRLGGDPEKFAALIQVLQKHHINYPCPDPKGWDHALEKYENEFKKMVKDQIVIDCNKECIEGVFEKVKDEKKKIGLTLPNEVVDVLNEIEDLNSQRQNWGMISLQTPVNVASGKEINSLLLYLAKKLPGPKKLVGYLKMLAGADTSELDPIYREMKGFQKATDNSKEKGIVQNGLYFVLPTNFIGANKSIFRLGPFEVELPLKSALNKGLIDKTRYDEINKETEKSTQTVYDLAVKAQNLIRKKIDDPSLGKEKKEVLQRYLTSLTSLIDQTFDVQDVDGKKKAKLKPPVGADAQYETIGRLTTLMGMLNFNTTGHCRSGNNRTAAWLAKSHQVVGAMANSKDGSIPPPKEMAGSLRGTIMAGTLTGQVLDRLLKPLIKKGSDHWSLDIFLNCFESSLTLQQANKGTRGTKLGLAEIKDKGFRKALTKGAFDLAGRYEEKQLDKARNGMIRDLKVSQSEKNKTADTFLKKLDYMYKNAKGPEARKACISRLKKFQKVFNEQPLQGSEQDKGDAKVLGLRIIEQLNEMEKSEMVKNSEGL